MKLKNVIEKVFPFLYSNKTYTAFGVEEAPTRYPLNKARYLRMAAYIHEEYLKQQRPLRVLDIGCNEGMMILYCRKNCSDVEFHGIDILPEKRDKSLERGYKSVLLEDIRECPFGWPENFFDVVICSHILEHLEHPGDLLEKLSRIVRKGGLLIVGVPIGLLPGILWRRHITPLYSPINRKEEALKRFGHVSFFSLPELKKLLKNHGFIAEEARGDYFLRSRRFFIENYKWWFDLNQWYGKIFPGVWGHVTVKSRFQG
ncbi:MAG: class I SAM-dependent methyltransferase [Candidatus Omnitrophota bacterium]|nr:class I SAM-dependent methyltransferase [Candidatus Omnitrophota bacterium]